MALIHAGKIETDSLNGPAKQALAERNRFLRFLVFEKAANVCAGLARDHEVQPHRVRGCPVGSNDFHVVAVAQHCSRRHELAIHAGVDAVITDVGVNRIGEIDHGSALRQLLDLAIRGENVNLVREQVAFEIFEELPRVARFLLNIEEVFQPLQGFLRHIRATGLAALVQPMRRHAYIGHTMHFFGTDLNLHRYTEWTENNGVQGLIAVRFGNGDVILEQPGDRLVHIMNHTEHAITGVYLVHHYAKSVDIIDLLERKQLLAHLAVNAVEILLAASYLGFNAFLLKLRDDCLANLLDDRFAIAVPFSHCLLQHAVPCRVQIGKTQVLELVVPLAHAEAVGDRRINVKRFPRDVSLLVSAKCVQGAHVMQSIRQLDQDHAYVPPHCEQHLAEILCLLFFLGLKLDLVDLADTINQIRNLFAKIVGNVLLRRFRVFDDVVEYGRSNALRIQAYVRQDACDFDGMIDIGLATTT